MHIMQSYSVFNSAVAIRDFHHDICGAVTQLALELCNKLQTNANNMSATSRFSSLNIHSCAAERDEECPRPSRLVERRLSGIVYLYTFGKILLTEICENLLH